MQIQHLSNEVPLVVCKLEKYAYSGSLVLLSRQWIIALCCTLGPHGQSKIMSLFFATSRFTNGANTSSPNSISGSRLTNNTTLKLSGLTDDEN